MLMIPLYLPLLGKEAFGLFGLFASLEIFFLLIEGGTGTVLIKDFAEKHHKGESLSLLLRTFESLYLGLGVLFTIICQIVIFAGAFNYLKIGAISSAELQTILLILSFRFLSATITIIHEAVIVAREQIVVLNATRLLFSLLSSVGAYLILRITEGNVFSFFIWWLGVTFLMGLIKAWVAWSPMKEKFFRERPVWLELKPYLRSQPSLMALAVAMFLFSQYPIWITSYAFDLATVGLFAICLRVSSTLGGSLSALSRPMVSRYASCQLRGQGGREVSKVVEVTMIMGVVGFIFFAFESPALFSVWLGKDFSGLDLVVRLAPLLLISTIIDLFSFPYVQILQAERKFKLLYGRYFWGVIIGVSVFFLLRAPLGVYAIGIARLSAALVCFLLFQPKMVRVCEPDVNVWSYLLKFLLPLSILTSALLVSIEAFIPLNDLSSFARLLLSMALMGAILAASIWGWKHWWSNVRSCITVPQ